MDVNRPNVMRIQPKLYMKVRKVVDFYRLKRVSNYYVENSDFDSPNCIITIQKNILERYIIEIRNIFLKHQILTNFSLRSIIYTAMDIRYHTATK